MAVSAQEQLSPPPPLRPLCHAPDRDLASCVQGIKLEQFIFDPFPHAASQVLVEVARDEQFAPVKNAPGSPADSPDTARAALLALHTRWVHVNAVPLTCNLSLTTC